MKIADVRSELIEDFKRNSFDELYSDNEYFLQNTKISWAISVLSNDEKITKRQVLKIIEEILSGKL